MEQNENAKEPVYLRELKPKLNSKIKKFYIVLGMLLLLLIPIMFIYGLLNDRQNYQQEALSKVRLAWAGAQVIESPSLSIKVPGKKEDEFKYLTLDNYDVEIYANTEYRKKGMFKVPVYTADVVIKGDFKNTYGNVKNQEVTLSFPVFDSKGFTAPPEVKFLSSEFDYINYTELTRRVSTNLKTIPFEIKYQLRGSDEIKVITGGQNNKIEIEGNWTNPEFTGDFLPKEKEVRDDGFEGEWTIPAIAASSIANPQAGVSFITPVDNYRMASRALKYSVLFLALTFLSFFIFEITSDKKKPIHQLQYLMMGAAMLIFYLLLISCSEIMAFWAAYAIAAIMTIILIGLYTYNVITAKQDKKFAFIISGIMFILYIFFYVLLAMQDFSLLIGSIVLFIIISLIMYSTRNVDWFNDNE